jgi:hypothetical protein
MGCIFDQVFPPPSAPVPRQEAQPLVLSEPANLTFSMPGEFTSGPTAEGQGGAAGAAWGSKGRLLKQGK